MIARKVCESTPPLIRVKFMNKVSLSLVGHCRCRVEPPPPLRAPDLFVAHHTGAIPPATSPQLLWWPGLSCSSSLLLLFSSVEGIVCDPNGRRGGEKGL